MGDGIGALSSAGEMLRALQRRDVSAGELVELHLERIERYDGALNAIPVRTPELAREAAARADEALAGGGGGGRLVGLPLTLKESTQTAGLPQSAGLLPFAQHRPTSDGRVAAAVLRAGACLLGKTNIPAALGDWQADSPVYGRTNNPWDVERTPGGSTGGGAAALAAGLTPLEVGSDIGGSIRVPAAYCGIYGHRPSETAIPRTGAFPLAELPNPAAVMGVQGPLARTATDLELLFDVLVGPDVGEDVAWRLDLPGSRHERLGEFRVAVMPAMPWTPVAGAVRARVDELAALLTRAGARVGEAMPELDAEQYLRDYSALLSAMTSQGRPRDERERAAQRLSATGDAQMAAMAEGYTLDAHDLVRLLGRREAARHAWRAFFTEWDVLVGPITLGTAFPHQTGGQPERTLDVDGEQVPYLRNIVYPMWAIFAGQPSTAFPAGRDHAGLPIGLQVIGPYLEDRTTLRFAQLLEREWYAFEPPPGY